MWVATEWRGRGGVRARGCCCCVENHIVPRIVVSEDTGVGNTAGNGISAENLPSSPSLGECPEHRGGVGGEAQLKRLNVISGYIYPRGLHPGLFSFQRMCPRSIPVDVSHGICNWGGPRCHLTDTKSGLSQRCINPA